MVRLVFRFTGILLPLVCFVSCASLPKGNFGEIVPPPPHYNESKYWAALPTQMDSADAVPVATWNDVQSTSHVDVFFIHPTTYTGKPGQKEWNADCSDEKVNLKTDRGTIKYQASIFNGTGRVYAPRYRQAHLECFYIQQKKDAIAALDLAYQDVSAAFQYYLANFNEGRPFIIASHSQGTYHGKKLIEEFIDGKPLQKQFIVGYLAGYPIAANAFKNISPCTQPDETGCFCSWRTFREGYIPAKLHFPDTNVVTTNPVTWNTTIPVSGKEVQQGAVLRDFCKVYPHLVSTTVHEDLLWVCKPVFPWSFLFTTKNYHIADYNLFYADVRQNAQDRVKAYFENQ